MVDLTRIQRCGRIGNDKLLTFRSILQCCEENRLAPFLGLLPGKRNNAAALNGVTILSVERVLEGTPDIEGVRG